MWNDYRNAMYKTMLDFYKDTVENPAELIMLICELFFVGEVWAFAKAGWRGPNI